MRVIIRVTTTDGTRVADISVGRGVVELDAGGPADEPVRRYLGFRTPAKEEALRESEALHGHRFEVLSNGARSWLAPGAVLTADRLLAEVGWQHGGRPQEQGGEAVLHQAFLDTLFTVTQANGRVIRATSLQVFPHYRTILEGSPIPRANQITREAVTQAAERLGKPLVIVEPALIPLRDDPRRLERYPRCACAAALRSAPLDGAQTWSQLTLLWWQERLDLPWPEALAAALRGVEWEAQAADVDFW